MHMKIRIVVVLQTYTYLNSNFIHQKGTIRFPSTGINYSKKANKSSPLLALKVTTATTKTYFAKVYFLLYSFVLTFLPFP